MGRVLSEEEIDGIENKLDYAYEDAVMEEIMSEVKNLIATIRDRDTKIKDLIERKQNNENLWEEILIVKEKEIYAVKQHQPLLLEALKAYESECTCRLTPYRCRRCVKALKVLLKVEGEDEQVKPLQGFQVFHCGDEESSFVAPKADMTIEEFVAEANRMVSDEWGLEEDYKEMGYPWKPEDVATGVCTFDPTAEDYESQTFGVWFLSDKFENPVECYVIDLD